METIFLKQTLLMCRRIIEGGISMSFTRILKAAVILAGVLGGGSITARGLYENNRTESDNTEPSVENSFSVSSTFITNELYEHNQAVDSLDQLCMLRAQIASEYAEGVCTSAQPNCVDEKGVNFFLEGNEVKEMPEKSKALDAKKDRIHLISEATKHNVTRLLHQPTCLPIAMTLLEEHRHANNARTFEAKIERNLKVSKLWKDVNPAKDMKLSKEEKQRQLTTKYAVVIPGLYSPPQRDILETILFIELIPFAAVVAPAILMTVGLTSPAWIPFIYFCPEQTTRILETLGYYYIADKSLPSSMNFYNDLDKAKSAVEAADKTDRGKSQASMHNYYILEFEALNKTGEILNISKFYGPNILKLRQYGIFDWQDKDVAIHKDFTLPSMKRLEQIFQQNKEPSNQLSLKRG
jgi:hypothetical protein